MGTLPPPPGGLPPGPEPAPREEPSPPAPGATLRRSRLPLALVAMAFVGLLGVAACIIAFATAREPCAGADFTSARFGYCVAIPDGWRTEAAASTGPAIDRLLVPAQPATVSIQAFRLTAGQSLSQFADHVRSLDRAAGYEDGDTSSRSVAGLPAIQWDVAAPTGVTTTRVRDVVFARGGVVWRVELGDTENEFASHTADLDRILLSWHFR